VVDRRGGWSLGIRQDLDRPADLRRAGSILDPEWPADGPIIDAIAPAGDFNAVTSAGRKTTTLFDTSHPQLCQALRPDKRWRQLSGNMVGNNKTRSGNSIRRSQAKRGAEQIGGGGGYGGHFRAVQGFRYYGKVGLDA